MATCGHCKSTGVTVGHVRECAGRNYGGVLVGSAGTVQTTGRINGGTATVREPARYQSDPYNRPSGDWANLATDKQIKFITELCAERSIERPQLSTLTKRSASEFIARVLETPKPAAAVAPSNLPDVPAGRYALNLLDDSKNPSGEWKVKFYRVDRPTEGPWAGRTFLKVQASDEFHNIRNAEERAHILGLIAADLKAAMLRYGRELGQCGHCGRTLTNEESRAAGIGPICRGKMGW